MGVAREPMRPYSKQYWLELQRRAALEREQTRRAWMFAGLFALGVMALVTLIFAVWRLPGDWKQKGREKGKELIRRTRQIR